MEFKKLCIIVVIINIAVMFSSCAAGTSSSKVSSRASSAASASSASGKSKLFSGVDSSFLENPKTYTDKHFNFSVSYPDDWQADIEEYWESTSGREGSPDGGIDIYVEGSKSDVIRVFGQYGTLDSSIIDFDYSTEDTQEKFVTSSGLAGDLYYNDNKQTIKAVVLFDSNNAVQIEISDAAFTRDKQKIYAILKSIKITGNS